MDDIRYNDKQMKKFLNPFAGFIHLLFLLLVELQNSLIEIEKQN